MLLVRGARRGCFHPRSFAVLTGSLPRRAFSPRARLSAAAVWRLLLRGQHGYTLLYAICRGLSSRRVYFLYPYAVKGLLLGLTMSRPLSPPAVLPHAPSLPARRGGRPCPRNTAQRCHSEPVRRLAWESVPLASLCKGRWQRAALTEGLSKRIFRAPARGTFALGGKSTQKRRSNLRFENPFARLHPPRILTAFATRTLYPANFT